MAIFKRGRVFWFSFTFNGQRIQQSTKQRNRKVAVVMESTYRSRLAQDEAGIHQRKVAPTFSDFATQRFLPWAEATFASKPKTWKYYRNGVRRLKEHAPLSSLRLDAITSEEISGYVAKRRSAGLTVASVNREIQVLRRALHLAVEWNEIASIGKIKMLSGEEHRERVITPREENLFLAAASEPLASIATVLVDSGQRPEEAFRMQWENLRWASGRYGSMLVTHGKTAAARRTIPMTPRVRTVLEARWLEAGKPEGGWVWPAETRSGHVEPSSVRKLHAKTFQTITARTAKDKQQPVDPFVLYSLRHTFLTRLGESGCDAWTLARIAGHSSISISARYVHPSDDGVLTAMERFGGQNIPDSTALAGITETKLLQSSAL